MMKMRKIVFLILTIVFCSSCVVFAKTKAPKTHPDILYPSCNKSNRSGMYVLEFYVKTYEKVNGYRYRIYFNGSEIKSGSYNKNTKQIFTVTKGHTYLELSHKYKGKSIKNRLPEGSLFLMNQMLNSSSLYVGKGQ